MRYSQAELLYEAFNIKTEQEYIDKIEDLVKKGLMMTPKLIKHFDNIMPEKAFNPLQNGIITDLKH